MIHHRKCASAAHNSVSAPTRLAEVAALACLAAFATPAQATTQSGFAGTVQWHGPFGDLDVMTKSATFDLKLKTKGDSDLYVIRNAIAVGGTSGWHTHPGPSLVTVTLGEITVYDAAVCAPTRYAAGDTFVDDGDHVHLIRNESGAVAETGAVQLIPRGATRRIDAPQPNNCPASLH
jgi:quercetin dioxygenase-like cupin family protein